jgi:hypothetical protein
LQALWRATPANALTFDFSFDGGAVTGEVDGLFAGGTGEAATHVIVKTESVPGLGFTPPYDTISDTVQVNSFDVNAAGQITTATYLAYNGTYDLCLSYGYCAYFVNCAPSFLTVFSNPNGASGFDLTFTSATPLPAALPLFATGLGGLGLLGWRRKRKAQAVA